MNPLALIPSGIGAAAGLVGAGLNAAALPGKRRKAYGQIDEETEELRRRALMNALAASGGGDTSLDGNFGGSVDGGLADELVNQQDIAAQRQRARDQVHENTQLDPMTFVPFAQNAATFGQKLYDQIEYDDEEDRKRGLAR